MNVQDVINIHNYIVCPLLCTVMNVTFKILIVSSFANKWLCCRLQFKQRTSMKYAFMYMNNYCSIKSGLLQVLTSCNVANVCKDW